MIYWNYIFLQIPTGSIISMQMIPLPKICYTNLMFYPVSFTYFIFIYPNFFKKTQNATHIHTHSLPCLPTCRMVKFSSTLSIIGFSGSVRNLRIKLMRYSHSGERCSRKTKRPSSQCGGSAVWAVEWMEWNS